MKKGISIWSFSEGNLRDKFASAKKAGYDGVEVALDEVGEIGLESTREDMQKVLSCANECGIQLYSVASGLYWKYNYTSNDADIREKAINITKKQIQIASWLNCDTILVVPGVVTGDVSYDVAYDRALQAVQQLAPFAEQHKVYIGLENVWNKFLLSPLEMRDFIDRIGNQYVAAYFDVGNVLYSGYPEQWIKILAHRIKKIHIKDFRMAVGNINGFVDLLSGDVNFPAVVEALRDIGYDDWCTAEMDVYKYHPHGILYTTAQAMKLIFE